jgi:hypothetical protein
VSRLTVVAIGRNEGERLRRCLDSVAGGGIQVVYVDSGSSDGSVALARDRGAAVVELDMSVPFTAARARNAGLERALALAPDLELVQFVDGDCEVASGWLERARAELDADATLGAVCGRRRERFRERTVYNRLCDIEWDTPIGRVKACGGDVMMRASALRDAGGFNPAMIAGEEPELCVRLRQRGWIEAEMTGHDAAMDRVGQWWARAVRSGHAFAEGYALHGGPPERLWAAENRSVLVRGLVIPLLSLGAAWPTGGWSLALLAAYPLLLVRYYRKGRRLGIDRRDARAWAVNCLAAAFPQVVGQITYVRRRLLRSPARIIEYKGPAA